jgi:hypothetical protein
MFDPAELGTRIAAVDAATTTTDKGSAFERLAEYVFMHLDGVEVRERDMLMPSEEIDIVLWNAQLEDVLRPWDPVILVECKNWSSAVGGAELSWFISKMRTRGLSHGIFIAANGVTGNFVRGDGTGNGAAGIIAAALSEKIRVIVITLDDIRRLASLDDMRELLKARFCGIFVRKVL